MFVNFWISFLKRSNLDLSFEPGKYAEINAISPILLHSLTPTLSITFKLSDGSNLCFNTILIIIHTPPCPISVPLFYTEFRVVN